MSTSKINYWIGVIVLLLVAFVLRVYRLGDTNVWWDEAYSVWLARMSLADAINITGRDVHPPLYYILLNFSIYLWGSSEFAIRYLSVLPALLSTAILYLLGKALVGGRWAFFVFGWLAVSRFHIWWSQETRMYTWAAFWAVWSFYFLWQQVGKRPFSKMPSKWGWLAYFFGMLAGLYTLYLYGLVYLAVGLTVVLLWFLQRIPSQKMGQWILVTAASLLLFLPWVLFSKPNQPGQFATNNSIVHLIQLYLSLLANGESTNLARFSFWMAGFILLAAFGFTVLAQKKRIVPLVFLFPAFVLPPVMAVILFLIKGWIYTPAIEARYYLLLMPINLLGLTAALAAVASFRQRTAVLSGVVVIGLAVNSLPGYYSNRHLRDQWKSAMTMIRAYAQPQDRVMLVSGDRYPVFLYEYEKFQEERPSVYLVPDGVPVLTPATINTQMTQAAGDADRIWLVEIERAIQDPDNLARTWLDDRWELAFSSRYDYNALTLYTAVGERPSPTIAIKGVDVTIPLNNFRPGDTVHLGLQTAVPETRLQIIHDSGLIMFEQTYPEEVPTFIDVPWPVTQATPKGRYSVHANAQEMVTFKVENSDPLLMITDIPNRTDVELGSIRLLGFGMKPKSPAPGDSIQLDLYWQSTAPVETSYTVFTQLVGPFNPFSGNPLWGQHDTPPVSGTFPTTTWPVGMIVRDSHAVTFSEDAPEAGYTLLIGLYDADTGTRLPVSGSSVDAIELLKFTLP